MSPLTLLFNYFQRSDFLLLLERPCLDSHQTAHWYPNWVYETMETDEVRNRAYRKAIVASVRDRVVLELGTGPRALWARYCAEQGARKVYAIEANDASFQSAQSHVKKAGWSNIEVIHGFSDRVHLPEKCDVLVHDLVGSIGSSEGMAGFVEDAKARLLKPGATHLPSRCVTYFFPTFRIPMTHSERAFNTCARGFKRYERIQFGRLFGFRPEAMLAEPQVFEDLRLDQPMELTYEKRAHFEVRKDGLWDGIAFFIKLYLGEDECIDSLASRTNWFITLVRPFSSPVAVVKGDTIACEGQTDLTAARPTYRLTCRHGRTPRQLSTYAEHLWGGS